MIDHRDLSAFVGGVIGSTRPAEAELRRADDDLAVTLTAQQAMLLWTAADGAHGAWSAVEAGPAATTFLAALLLHDKWTRRG